MPTNRPRRAPSSRSLGWAVLALVVVSLLFSAWTNYEAAERAQCQADLNAEFLSSLSFNADLNAADRENLANAITAITESDSREETREILATYEERRAEIDAERQEYPPLPEDVCDE